MALNSEEQIRDLETRLKQVLAENEELHKDVENLCLQNQQTTFNMFPKSSSTIEKNKVHEIALKTIKSNLSKVTQERDSLKAELAQVYYTKVALEKEVANEKQKRCELEEDNQFYKSQASMALSDRDLARLETEDLKREASKLEVALADASGKLLLYKEQLDQAHRELEANKRDLADAPELKKRLKEMTESMQQLEQTVTSRQGVQNLETALNQCQDQLAATMKQMADAGSLTASLSDAVVAATVRATEAEARLAESQRSRDAARQEAAESQQAAAAASARCDELAQQVTSLEEELANMLEQISLQEDRAREADCEANKLRQEVEVLQGRLMEAENRLARSTGNAEGDEHAQKLAAEDFEEHRAILQRMVTELKIKLAQATLEKVEALMQAAAAASNASDATLAGTPPNSHVPAASPQRVEQRQSRSHGSTGTSPQYYAQLPSIFFWRTPPPLAPPTPSVNGSSVSGGDESDVWTRANIDGSSLSVSEMSSQLAALERLMLTMRVYRTKLAAAAEVLWGDGDAGDKEEAVADVVALGEDVEVWRAKAVAAISAVAAETQLKSGSEGQRTTPALDSQLAMEVIELMSLCIWAVRESKRRSALALTSVQLLQSM